LHNYRFKSVKKVRLTSQIVKYRVNNLNEAFQFFKESYRMAGEKIICLVKCNFTESLFLFVNEIERA